MAAILKNDVTFPFNNQLVSDLDPAWGTRRMIPVELSKVSLSGLTPFLRGFRVVWLVGRVFHRINSASLVIDDQDNRQLVGRQD